MGFKTTLTTMVLPFSILILYLFQIYAQYSTFITARSKDNNAEDGRNSMLHYKLSKTKEYDFNVNKIKKNLDDNILMKIGFFKNMAENYFESPNSTEGEIDNRYYMLFYLFLYDFLVLIIVYIFIYGSFKAGCIKIFLQSFRIYSNTKRMNQFNKNMNVFQIISSKLENNYKMRGWSLFNSEGFFVIEYLCNIIIILDILYLFVLYFSNKKSKKIKNDNVGAVVELNEAKLGSDSSSSEEGETKLNENKKLKMGSDDSSSGEKNNNVIELNEGNKLKEDSDNSSSDKNHGETELNEGNKLKIDSDNSSSDKNYGESGKPISKKIDEDNKYTILSDKKSDSGKIPSELINNDNSVVDESILSSEK